MSDLYLVVNFKVREYLSPAAFGFSPSLDPTPDGGVGMPKEMIDVAERICDSGRWPPEVGIVGNGKEAPSMLTPEGFYPAFDYVKKHFKDISGEIKADEDR